MLIPAIGLLLTTAFIGSAFQSEELCNSKELKQKAKDALSPYKYDSGRLTKIMYKKKVQLKEMEVPVFIGEKYKLVFVTENITRNVVINIYNKDKESSNRKQLWTSKNAPAGETTHAFVPEKRAMKYFVDYEIPAVADSLPDPECVMFTLGYQ